MICNVEECKEPHKAKGMCKKHYDREHKALARGKVIQVGDFCKRGHKIAEDNAQFYLNHGEQRVRCKQCNQPSSNRFKIGDRCKSGHVIEGDNVLRQMRNGSEYFRCQICERRRNRINHERYGKTVEGQMARIRADANRALKRTSRDEAAVRADELLKLEVVGTAGKYASLNYLRLTKRAARAHLPLEEAYDKSKSRCYKNPKDYIDYDELHPPSAVEANRMCVGCPMLVECARFANAYQPVVGVWGGEVWRDGKIISQAAYGGREVV